MSLEEGRTGIRDLSGVVREATGPVCHSQSRVRGRRRGLQGRESLGVCACQSDWHLERDGGLVLGRAPWTEAGDLSPTSLPTPSLSGPVSAPVCSGEDPL